MKMMKEIEEQKIQMYQEKMNIMKEIEEQKFLLEEEKTRFEAQKILHSKKQTQFYVEVKELYGHSNLFNDKLKNILDQ